VVARHCNGVLFAERANELVLYGLPKKLCFAGAVKARLNRRLSYELDPNPSELRMSRVNFE